VSPTSLQIVEDFVAVGGMEGLILKAADDVMTPFNLKK